MAARGNKVEKYGPYCCYINSHNRRASLLAAGLYRGIVSMAAHRQKRRGTLLTSVALCLVLAGAVAAQQGSAPVTKAPEDDPVTLLETLTVSAAEIPKVGEGAPLFTPQELHDKGYTARGSRGDFEDGRQVIFECYLRVYGKGPTEGRMRGYDDGAAAAAQMSNWARVAEAATLALGKGRIDMLEGKITQADFEKLELARQGAVIQMTKAEMDFEEAKAEAIDIQEAVKQRAHPLDFVGIVQANAAERAGRKYSLIPKEFEDLKLEHVQAVERNNSKGEPYLFVTGAIVNTHQKRIAIPPLSFTAVDQAGYPLVSERGQAGGRIEPGQSKAFTYSLSPKPPHAARVTVTFAELRAPTHLDPPQMDPVCMYNPETPYKIRGSMGSGDPVPDDIAVFDPRTSGGAPARPSGRVNTLAN